MSWLEISVAVTAQGAESVSELLEQLGAAAVVLRSGDDQDQVLEPLPGEQPLWGSVSLSALFDLDLDIAELRRALSAHEALITDATFVEDDDWQNLWQAHAVRACFNERLWLLPRGTGLEGIDPAVPVLRLDPGLAFGSGSHPTTRLCLSWLAQATVHGARVLDFGCGSGILALAACLLGAEQVTALDHDPQALVATRDNAAYNDIDDRQLRVITPDQLATVAGAAGVFDVVIANILANPLVELADLLTARLADDGHMVLSGLLHHQEPMIREAYTGVLFHNVARDGEWIRMDGVRREAGGGAARGG